VPFWALHTWRKDIGGSVFDNHGKTKLSRLHQMSTPCMQRSFAKEISLCAAPTFILWYVLLDSWNKKHINMNRRKCLIIMIKLYCHLVILVLELYIFSSRNRISGKVDLSHGQHSHSYKYTCTKFQLSNS